MLRIANAGPAISFEIVAKRIANAFVKRGVPAMYVRGYIGHIMVDAPTILVLSDAYIRFGDTAEITAYACTENYVAPSPFALNDYVSVCGDDTALGWVPDPIPDELFNRPQRQIDALLVYIPMYPFDIKNYEWWKKHGHDVHRLARENRLTVICKTKNLKAPYCDEYDHMTRGKDPFETYSHSIILWLSRKEGFGMPPYEAVALGSIAVIPYASYIPIVGYPYQYRTVTRHSVILGTYWWPDKASLVSALTRAIEDSGDHGLRERLRWFAYWAHEANTVLGFYRFAKRVGLPMRMPRFLPSDWKYLEVGARLMGLSHVLEQLSRGSY